MFPDKNVSSHFNGLLIDTLFYLMICFGNIALTSLNIQKSIKVHNTHDLDTPTSIYH